MIQPSYEPRITSACVHMRALCLPPPAMLSSKQKSLWRWCSVKSCLTCDLVDCSPPVSSVHGISQARILERVATSYSITRDGTCVFCIGRWIFFFFFFFFLPLSLQGSSVELLTSCKGPDPLFNSNVATAEKS